MLPLTSIDQRTTILSKIQNSVLTKNLKMYFFQKNKKHQEHHESSPVRPNKSKEICNKKMNHYRNISKNLSLDTHESKTRRQVPFQTSSLTKNLSGQSSNTPPAPIHGTNFKQELLEGYKGHQHPDSFKNKFINLFGGKFSCPYH